MKAVILAAGMGTRLGSLIPKPLTSLVNEKTILDYLVDQLDKHIGRDNIIVVTGYKKEIIMEKFPDLLYIYNDAYAHTNTSKSLLRAFQKIDDDVLWFNGDVYFDDGVIELLSNTPGSSCLVDTKKVDEEEVKYDTNENGTINELSKQVEQPLGEALGINLLRRADLPAVREQLAAVDDNDYFEKALENLTMHGKLNLTPVDVGDLFCTEIDFPEDLERAQHHLQSQS